MALNIDTTSTQYQNRLVKFRTFRNEMKPLVKQFFKMSEAQKEQWLARDPLLAEFIEMCKKVTVKNDDG